MSNDIDQHIRDALRAEDQELAANGDEVPEDVDESVAPHACTMIVRP